MPPSTFETVRDGQGRTHRLTGLFRDRDQQHRDRTPEEQAQVDAILAAKRQTVVEPAPAADVTRSHLSPRMDEYRAKAIAKSRSIGARQRAVESRARRTAA